MRKLLFVNCDMVENKRGEYIYPKEWYKSELQLCCFHYKEKYDEKDNSDSDDDGPLLTVLNPPKFLKDYYKDDEEDEEFLEGAQDNHTDGNQEEVMEIEHNIHVQVGDNYRFPTKHVGFPYRSNDPFDMHSCFARYSHSPNFLSRLNFKNPTNLLTL